MRAKVRKLSSLRVLGAKGVSQSVLLHENLQARATNKAMSPIGQRLVCNIVADTV
jgi:hypothetical protein